MSRYTTNKEGICIGSDNIFFYHDADGTCHNFNCIVSIRPFSFSSFTGLSICIKTPAQQLVIAYRPANENDRLVSQDSSQHIVCEISGFFTDWFNKNTPGWGVPPSCRPCDFALFFKKRSHAVAFREEVMRHLKGISIKD